MVRFSMYNLCHDNTIIIILCSSLYSVLTIIHQWRCLVRIAFPQIVPSDIVPFPTQSVNSLPNHQLYKESRVVGIMVRLMFQVRMISQSQCIKRLHILMPGIRGNWWIKMLSFPRVVTIPCYSPYERTTDTYLPISVTWVVRRCCTIVWEQWSQWTSICTWELIFLQYHQNNSSLGCSLTIVRIWVLWVETFLFLMYPRFLSRS